MVDRIDMKYSILILILSLTWSTLLAAAPTEVVATVDKNPITVEESIQLQIVANDDVANNALDTSPLLKDFVVGRTSVSRQTQIINFDTSKTTRWTTVLIPRREGRLTIPSLSVAGLQTDPITLSVLPVSASNAAQGRELFITTEVDLEQVYIQQQIRYTVKLHLALDLQRGSLSAPEVTDADIEQVGNDKEYSEIIDGKRYRIIERTFSIIPNKSGEFVIRGPYFEGEVTDPSRQSFGFFNRTKSINRVAKNIDITVLPMPEGYQEHWLPSEFVQLNEEWQPDSSELTVGTPVTRTITLTAVGVVEEQLPEIGSNYPEDIKAYPDQADSATVQRNGTFVAQRTETTALIPNSDGSFTIPKVRVPWFNVIRGKTEYAELPERRISVLPAEGQQPAPVEPEVTSEPVETITPAPESTLQQSPIAPAFYGFTLTSWALLGLWIITLILWWFQYRKTKRPSPMKINVVDDSWHTLEKTLMQKKPSIGAIQLALRKWLQQQLKLPGAHLPQLLDTIGNEDIRKEYELMVSQQYSPDGVASAWNSKRLLELLRVHKKQQRKILKHHTTTLEPLYQ